MKTKCSFILKSSIALLLAVLMLFGSISTVLAATVDMASTSLAAQGSIYADLSGTSNWGTSVSYIVGKSNYSTSYNMTQLSGTKLYYKNIGSDWASDATQNGFHNGAWGTNSGADQKISDRWGSTKHTSINTSYGCNNGSTYLATISGTKNEYSLSFDYYSGGYSDFNKKLTIKTALKSGSTYSETNTKLGTFSASNAVKITGDSTTTAQSISQTGGTGEITTAKTNTATISQTTESGYTFKGWKLGSLDTSGSGLTTGSYSFTGSGEEKTLYAYYEQNATTYTSIAVAAKGSTDESTFNTALSGTPATISANSYTTGSSALNISAGTVSGYTFYKWVVTAGSGTIGSATSASTTFTPSASNTTVTAQYKKNYTIKNDTTDTHGTVTLDYTSRVAGQTYKATVTPKDGYKIKTLTVGGSAVSAAAGKTSAYTYNGTANGTSDTISVVATFESNTAMKLYIAGRFRVRPSEGSSSWTTTYASGYDWNATSTNIPFTYLSGTTYKVDTNATLAELSAKIGSSTYTGDPVFFVYDKTETTEKNWYASSATTMSTSGTTLVSSSGADSNLKFNSTSTDGPVTIYYDSNTHKIWYSIPNLYNVTVGSVTGGSVTASPARCEAGTSVTLTITPSAGYTLQSITAKDSSNATVALSGSGNTRTFTMPAKDVTVTPVFQATNYTITYPSTTTGYTLGGSKPTQATVGTNVSFTVTPQTGYRIDEVKYNSTKITGSNNTYSFTMPAADVTIAVTASKVNTVKAVTNKSARGTVSVNKDTAAKNDSIKITVSPKNGVLKSLTATYGNGAVYTCNLSTKAWTKTTNATTNANAAPASTGALETVFLNPLKSMFGDDSTDIAEDDVLINAKPEIASTGAVSDIAGVGVDTDYPMTLAEDSSVTINATFDAYSGESTWYYNGYDTSGNALSGYHSKQMTESMVSGEKFSYYHVEGRTGNDQLMTVSNGKVDSGTRYVYFTNLKSGGWDYNHSPYAHFDGKTTWPGIQMEWYTDNDMGQPVYRAEIPAGATQVQFHDNNQHQSTVSTDLASGGYYVDESSSWDSTYQKYNHTIHSYSCSYPSAGASSSGTEYFYDSEIYTADFSTKGFWNHNVGSTQYSKPKDLGSYTGDYYINVLYAGKTYTINGTTKTIGSKPLVIWSAEPLAGDDENVTVYAKDGAIRAETFGATYANIADTKIYAANGTSTVGTKHSGSITNQTYETYKAAKGDTIVIKTQIGATDSGTLSNADALKAKYYVRGFCVNGEVSELLEWNTNGLYTLTYKIPEDTEITKFEITPIYYLKDTGANPIVTYRVTGFTDELKQVGAGKPGWGDTLYTYPYYGKLGGDSNAFGAYPGQPMVYYKGQYQMQIPQKSTTWVNTTSSNTTVSGVTMSNGYWDSVHKSIMGYGDNSTSADHVQTYDYGDFYKIFNEKKPVDNIVFDFKYRTKKHNLVNDNTSTNIAASTLTSAYGTNGNGFEMLTNFHGKNVDLFGNPLSGTAADPEQTTPIYVVSIGGVNDNVSGVENIAGYYATEWRVYAPNTPTSLSSTYKKVTVGNKSSIPPEVLVLNNDDTTSFNTTTYPSADASHNVTDWKAMYTELKKYAGHPVMISYEAADAQQGQGMYYTGTGGATRNDGRWLYSKNGENITSNIKIQYSDDNGVTYYDLDKTTPQVNGLSAYFTNDGVEGQMTYSTTIDPDKTFAFEAKTTNGNYKFVGWYMEDGTKITSDNASHTERSGSYTFVAKFMQVQSGQLILSHSADKGTISGTDYQGAGTAKIKAVVKDGDEVIRTYDLTTSDITLDDKIIKSDSTYTIEVTLEATATGNDNLGTTVLANPNGQDATYFNAASTTTEGKTKTIVLNSFPVSGLFDGTTQQTKNIIYHSYFAATTFHYELVFEYKDRNGDTKQYYRSGFLTAAQAANPNYVDVIPTSPTSNERRLMPAFIETVAPHISNFAQEDVEWDIASTGYQFSVMNYKYTLERAIVTRQRGNDKKNVTFVLPYAHNDGIATGGNAGTAAETTNFELIGDNAVTFDTIPVLLNGDENGIYTEEGKKNWIAAPATLDDNGTTKYFQYWSVKSTAADKDTDPEVARCYFQGFNFCALDNYIVTPIYGDQSTDISNSGIYTGASFLETSRNQWNGNATTEEIDHYTVDPTTGRKKASADDRAAAADLLYNDFILNYNYKGVDIYKGNSDSDDIKELGVVVERVKELDINQDGSKITDVSHYASVEQDLDTINGIINGTVSTSSKYMKDTVAKTALDNKNRIKFYEAFYNGAGWVKDNQDYASKYTYKNYVYRAYTYIKYKNAQGNDQIELSVPAYFTMYDEATANYKASTSTTSGN